MPDQNVSPTVPDSEWLRRFFEYLSGERAYSQHTILAYKESLYEFRFALTLGLLERSTDDIAKFIAGALTTGVSPKTVKRKFSAIRSFYQFLFMEGALERNPTRNMRSPKAYDAIIRPITSAEVDKELATITTGNAGLRDKALIYTAYGSGLRVSELINLAIPDLNIEGGIAKVRLGKGKKDRLVPLNAKQAEAIREYLVKARPEPKDSDATDVLFLGRRGERLTRQRVWQIFTELSADVIGRKVSPHKYRHAFITDTINGGAGVRVVQHMAGHGHVNTTKNYLHHNMERIRKEYLRAHPRGGESCERKLIAS